MGLYKARREFESDSFDFTLEVDFQLNSFSNYIELTQKTLEEDITQKIAKYNKIVLEDNNDWDYDVADHEIKVNTYKLYHNSLFVMLFSFLEKKMYQFCKIAESSYEIKLNDISGQGISKYKLYLTKVVKIDFSMLNSEWSEISKLNELRNLIIHKPNSEIEINENNSKLIKTLKSINNLNWDEKNNTIDFYIKGPELIIEFSRKIYKFLEKIYLDKK